MHDVVLDSVFDVACAVLADKQPLRVSLILGEKEFSFSFAKEPALSVSLVLDLDPSRSGNDVFLGDAELLDLAQGGAIVVSAPRPSVAKPNGRKNRQVRFGRTSVSCTDPDENVFRARFGVLREDVEITVFVEGACIQQLILEITSIPATVFFHELAVRKFSLLVLVQSLQVRVSRSGVQIKAILLHVLAVIAFIARKSK